MHNPTSTATRDQIIAQIRHLSRLRQIAGRIEKWASIAVPAGCFAWLAYYITLPPSQQALNYSKSVRGLASYHDGIDVMTRFAPGLWMIGFLAASWLIAALYNRRQQANLKAVLNEANPALSGTLIEAAEHLDATGKNLVYAALPPLLNRVHDEILSKWTASEVDQLTQLLHVKDPQLQLSALRVLQQIGNPNHLEEVNALLMNLQHKKPDKATMNQHKQLVAAAENCAETLISRVEYQRERETLLRATQTETAPKAEPQIVKLS
jgi:hypothetical protein